jgi:integrase
LDAGVSTVALTKIEIDKAEIKDKPYKLFDANGLFLLIKPNGSKLWRFRFSFGGTEKLLAIGPYPDVSLKEARIKRDDAKALLRDGVDPAAQKQADKRAAKRAELNSFERAAQEWMTANAPNWSERYSSEVKRRLEKNILPWLGRRPIAEIDSAELLEHLRRIEKRGSTDMSHRVLQHCGSIWRYATLSHYCARDITHELGGVLIKHKKVSHACIRREDLPDLIKAIDTYSGQYQTQLGLQLMCVTFVRTMELIAMPWSEISFEDRMWIIPGDRMKKDRDHMVPLSTHAMEILVELRRLNGRAPFVFTGKHKNKTMSNNTLLYALYRLGYKGQMTGHGFRSLASSILNEERRKSGVRMFNADAIERQLSHVDKTTRGVYNRAEYLQERIEMMQWWADYLGRVRSGGR